MMSEDTQFSIASIQKRMSAFVIDDIVIALLLYVIFYDQLLMIGSHLPTVITPESIEAFKQEINQFFIHNILLILSLKIVYHSLFVWQNGMTLGKYTVKIKVVELKRVETPSLPMAILRASLRIVSEAFFYLGFILAFFLPLKQTLHDKISGCVVIDA